MKLYPKIFRKLDNPFEVYHIDDKVIELHEMNDTDNFATFINQGHFYVWTAIGNEYKVIVERGYYDAARFIFEPEALYIYLTKLEELEKSRRRTRLFLFLPIIVLIAAVFGIMFFLGDKVEDKMPLIMIAAIVIAIVSQVVFLNKFKRKRQSAAIEYNEEVEALDPDGFMDALVKGEEYIANFYKELSGELEDEPVKEAEQVEEPELIGEEDKVVAPIVVPVEEEVVEEQDKEVVEEPILEEKPKVKPKVEKEPVEEVLLEDGEVDLSPLSIEELKEFAKDRKVKGFSTMRKGDLVNSLPKEYEELRVVELQALARKVGVPNFSTMRREELIEALKLGKPEEVVVEEVIEYQRVPVVSEEGTIDLSVLVVDDLKEFAKDRKVKGYSTMRKDELVEALPNELETLRVVELQALAREYKIVNYSTMRRTELIEEIKLGKVEIIVNEVEVEKEEPVVEEPAFNRMAILDANGLADLSVLKMEDLKEFAKDRKVNNFSTMRKNEIVEALPNELEELRLPELQALARAHQLPNFSTMRRDELIEEIKLGKPVIEEEVEEEVVEELKDVLHEDGTVNFGVLTINELKEFAKDRKVKGFSTMRKDELVEALPKELETLRVVELQALARARGVKNYSTMRKGELLEAIK